MMSIKKRKLDKKFTFGPAKVLAVHKFYDFLSILPLIFSFHFLTITTVFLNLDKNKT